MVLKVPVIEQCAVSNNLKGEVMLEDLSGYLQRNKSLIFPHRHNFYHFILFTKGRGRHTIDFESFTIEPWQIYFMSPGQIHTWDFEDGVDGYVVNFDKDFFTTFLLRPDYLTQFSFFSGLVRDEVFVVKEGAREIVYDVLNRLHFSLSEAGEKAVSKDYVQISLLYLFQELEKQRDPSNVPEGDVYNHTLLRNFLNLIELNYKEERLPKYYAGLLYITPNHLNALSKEFLGMSAGDIIRGRVLLEAKRLLVIKDYSISEIAYGLNFNDNSYFTKFFKKMEGCTPEEFRKIHV
ncbi:helix-turn-helix transcriptional regulator [Sphingobacterium sp. UT-1RO-CII-1]|uniref:AraC family transcriptional regulator n=1 Tax=Sphingobacterium sp. UT-1RO-CII-1 TaxID=2995225 RepID=UPI00227C6073|nr:helix-turn-helix transcriptional regulator [Sphingobacterium sp. UT-1RO-CII-1]MCY4780961.1 helix-turn-helix transcriptional regulator [Sphingobacterium sp. UT-1RO-CII-1]